MLEGFTAALMPENGWEFAGAENGATTDLRSLGAASLAYKH
jgi:hypothetical protein